jgi:DNA-binding response OmpR family regulator
MIRRQLADEYRTMRRSGTAGSVLRFGTFELDSQAGELRKGKTPIKLPPQPLKMLAMLASRPGKLVYEKKCSGRYGVTTPS